jgi:hypothetical protein
MEVPNNSAYTSRDWPEHEKNFAAMVTRMDSDIGRLMAQLRSGNGLAQSPFYAQGRPVRRVGQNTFSPVSSHHRMEVRNHRSTGRIDRYLGLVPIRR